MSRSLIGPLCLCAIVAGRAIGAEAVGSSMATPIWKKRGSTRTVTERLTSGCADRQSATEVAHSRPNSAIWDSRRVPVFLRSLSVASE